MNAQLLTIPEETPLPQVTQDNTMLAVIARAASDPKTDVDKLERLLAMKERMDAQHAEQEFNAALVRAQTLMRPISADATNPQTHSKYATYAKLDNALRPVYTKEGFSLSFNTVDSPKAEHVRVVCYVSHAGGHTRTYQADMPADGKGAKGNDVMTKTHASGAAMSYGMRYLLKMIFNVAVGEDDRDGNDPEPEFDSTAWAEAINGADLVYLRTLKKGMGQAEIPARARRNLEALWNKRFREVKP